MKTDFEIVKEFMKNSENIDLIWDSEALIWIDWREYDEDIVRYFNDKLEDKIEFEFIDNRKDYGEDIVLKKNDERLQIPYNEVMERDITIKYMNDFIGPQYQIRWFMESFGGDTLAFVLLTPEEWGDLEEEFGANNIKHYFSEINLDSAMFGFDLEIGEFQWFSELRKNNKGVDILVFQKIAALRSEKRQLDAKRDSGDLKLKDYYFQKKGIDEKISDLMEKYHICKPII